MAEIWDEARIQRYISEGIEESLNLDYKEARSIAKTDGKRTEITKDVSAMANSDGGTIIYGVAEYQDKAREHLPEKIDAIDRTEFSKEWLEHVIGNIRPKIDGIVIHPVPIGLAPNHAVYVVEIPQSHTAHQAGDKRYYRRLNFEAVPMEDYEIRDVMGRRQYPRIELEFEIEITQKEVQTGGTNGLYGLSFPVPGQVTRPVETKIVNHFELKIWAFNAGKVYAQYVNAFLEFPNVLLPVQKPKDEESRPWDEDMRETYEKDGIQYYQHYEDNTVREVIGFQDGGMFGPRPNYGPARHDPILPKRYQGWEEVELRADFDKISHDDLFIEWETFADNAPPVKGKIAVSDIELIDKRLAAK